MWVVSIFLVVVTFPFSCCLCIRMVQVKPIKDKVKPCSEKSGIIYWKSKILVRMTDFGDSNANGRRIYKILIILYSNRNLVMHFRKTIPYISWFHDPELWEWLGADPHNFRRRCFSYAPEPNYTNFKQKISMKSYKNVFFYFLCKSFPLNLSSRLYEMLNFNFVTFYL